jgi:enoyl-CoA hydratase/carnithine racemase
MLNSIFECSKPVIAAVNGAALGGGLALVGSCDIVLASNSAFFGLPEIDVGLLGGARHTARLMGSMRARRLMLTGEHVSARQLYRAGLIDDCLPDEALLNSAIGLATRISERSSTAVQLAKQSLNLIENMSLREGYRVEQDFTTQLLAHPDSSEAASAFLEKRRARFVSNDPQS